MDNMFYTLVAFYPITDSSQTHTAQHTIGRIFYLRLVCPFDVRTSSVTRRAHAHSICCYSSTDNKKSSHDHFTILTDKHKFILHIYQWPFFHLAANERDGARERTEFSIQNGQVNVSQMHNINYFQKRMKSRELIIS